MDASNFPDVGLSAANDAKAEIYGGMVYHDLQAMLRRAETVWCKAAERELERRKRDRFRRDQYTPEERFAAFLIDQLGAPDDPATELVEKVAEEFGDAERAVCA